MDRLLRIIGLIAILGLCLALSPAQLHFSNPGDPREPKWGGKGGGVSGGGEAATECTPYELLCENFEGVGYDETVAGDWQENPAAGGTIDPDEQGTVLRGSDSLEITNGATLGSHVDHDIAAVSGDTVWVHCMLRATETENMSYIIDVLDSLDARVVAYRLIAGGVGRIYCGGNASGPALADNTTYHVWISYHKGTGADAYVQLWVSANSTRGAVDALIVNGTSTTDVAKIRLFNGLANQTIFFDQVYVSNTEIVDVPN